MRTTLTLEDDLARRLHELSRRRGESFKEVVNATLRRGLQRGDEPVPAPDRFVVRAKPCGFRTGVDPQRLNQLVDEMEIEDFRHQLPGSRHR